MYETDKVSLRCYISAAGCRSGLIVHYHVDRQDNGKKIHLVLRGIQVELEAVAPAHPYLMDRSYYATAVVDYHVVVRPCVSLDPPALTFDFVDGLHQGELLLYASGLSPVLLDDELGHKFHERSSDKSDLGSVAVVYVQLPGHREELAYNMVTLTPFGIGDIEFGPQRKFLFYIKLHAFMVAQRRRKGNTPYDNLRKEDVTYSPSIIEIDGFCP